MKIRFLFSAILLLSISTLLNAQINVGATTAPQTGAIVQMTSGGTQGMLGPIVALTSLTSYPPVAGTATDGMLVFHSGANSIAAGYYAWYNNLWNLLKSSVVNNSTNTGLLEVISSLTATTISAGNTSDILGSTPTITLASTSTVLITYSGLGLPTNGNAPCQGSIDLLLDGTKINSSYFSGQDAPYTGSASTSLVRLGNYTTSQYVVTLSAGTHTIGLNAKCWFNSATFNINPVTSGYGGAIASDNNALKAKLSVLVIGQ